MAKGENAGKFVAFKLAGYVPGMEADANFEAVSFRFAIPDNAQGDIKAVNKFRGESIRAMVDKWGVKPLGAISVPGKTIDKALVQKLFALAKGDAERVAKAYALKYPTHEMDAVKVNEICASTEAIAKDLLGKV